MADTAVGNVPVYRKTIWWEWTFENDNGRNPQAGIARRYVEHWEDMRADNIGCLFWGGVGTGKSYLAGCIANALMEKEIPVHMTNFALILNDLAASFEGRNEYFSTFAAIRCLSLTTSAWSAAPSTDWNRFQCD